MTRSSHLDPPPGDRRNAVGVARFILASMVILWHSLTMFPVWYEHDPIAMATRGQTSLGGVAVNAFFVLSGFLIARSWTTSRGWSEFLVRRATRIYPAFLTAVLMTSCVAAPWLAARGGMSRPEAPSLATLILSASILDYPELAANGSLWVLRHDFYYYILIAAIGWAGLLARRWPILLMWAASWASYAALFTSGAEIGFELQHPRLLSCFFAGAVAYAYRERIPLKWSWFVAAVAVLALFSARWAPYRLWPYRVLPLVFPLAGAYVTLFASFRPGALAARLGWLGDYSYGLFLYAYPIQLVVLVLYRQHLTGYTHFLIAWAISIIAAGLGLVLIERPVLRLRRPRPPILAEVPAPHFRPANEPAEAVRLG